ncbi:MAG: NAD(P)/FAD-dependent oxidoreductase [Rhodanobacteraceae bacterium]
MQPTEHCDVLVIGGGPGGSTAATLLQRRGWKVIQLEKDRHPRFHIGESLLPGNLPIFEELGVLDKVRALGVLKLGADFQCGTGSYQSFYFRDALGKTAPHAFQVGRAQFDQMLFEHARANAVDARDGIIVERVAADGIDAVVAVARPMASTDAFSVRARYVVDASGRETLLGNAFKIKRRNPAHQSAAIFAHFHRVDARPGENAGNISIYHFDYGWCWFIPLREGVMSIGCVCWPEYLKRRRGHNREFLLDTLAKIPGAWARLSGAEMISEVRVTGNYSYSCERMAGPGWIMVGDAYTFVDPVFSSGVFLAMHSASRAAVLIDACLREPGREAALQAAFARRVRRGVRVFSWFIYRFNTSVMRGMFARPDNFLRVEDAVVSMLAGDVFENRAVLRRVWLFKLIYSMISLRHAGRWIGDRIARRRHARYRFSGGTTPVDPH